MREIIIRLPTEHRAVVLAFLAKNTKLPRALPFLSVSITPEVYLIAGNHEQSVTHELNNASPFPVVVKIKATAPNRFSVSSNCFYIEQKSSKSIEVRLSAGSIRSHRIDMLMLPCICTLNPSWKDEPSLAFKSSYKPIVRHVRYKAPRPWSVLVEGICQNSFDASKNIAKLCTDVGIFQSSKNTIGVNEFAIVDEVFAQNLEKDPLKSGKK